MVAIPYSTQPIPTTLGHQNLVNAIRRPMKPREVDALVAQVACSGACSCATEFDAREVSNTAWSFAWGRCTHDPLLDAIAAEALPRLARGNTDIYNHGCLWSLWRSTRQDMSIVADHYYMATSSVLELADESFSATSTHPAAF
eukprot:gnl/TRDRNA2_/TRDRNA2_177034_c0_seq3.p1 gnl/TRDRNA2_/TRDRNA2_177034_c0~~gnl/TRDRNA2_/TRDRNA2_177034_c0_seq3.p1  ORF type:complete len:143 (-),score=3.64 gnl/TRDRNA2_/TRDRNA2_177034_c0_seq3:36-464(-)